MSLFGNPEGFPIISIQGLFPPRAFDSMDLAFNTIRQPQFSGDGSTLFFVFQNTTPQSRLFAVDVASGERRDALASLTDPAAYYIDDYAVSGDGTAIALRLFDFEAVSFSHSTTYNYYDNGIHLLSGADTSHLTPSTIERLPSNLQGSDYTNLLGLFDLGGAVYYDYLAEDEEGKTLAEREQALVDANFLRRLPDGTVEQVDLNETLGDPLRKIEAISENGRYALVTWVDGTIPRGLTRVDLSSGATQEVIIDDAYTAENSLSVHGYYSTAAISRDGLFVLFDSLGHGADGHSGGVVDDVDSDLFLRNMATGEIFEVTQSAGDSKRPANGFDTSYASFSMSDDGRFIAFSSPVQAHLPDDTGGGKDLLVRDMYAGTLHRAALDAKGNAYDHWGPIGSVTLSSNGRNLAFSASPPGSADWTVGYGYDNDRALGSDIYVTDLRALGIWSPLVLRDPAEDVLQGTVYDDIILGSGANTSFDGTSGNDIILADGFSAGLASMDANLIYALYGVAFGRTPDAARYADWTFQVFSGATDADDLANGFAHSREFSKRYSGLDNKAFVDQMYLNAFGRAADAKGQDTWLGAIEAGMTRATVLSNFAESPEYTGSIAQAAIAYSQQSNPQWWVPEIFRLYKAALDRAPDLVGLRNWVAALAGEASYSEVAAGFAQSREFQNLFGELSVSAMITQLYRNVLDRAPEPGALDGWLALNLNNQQLLAGFANSREFVTGQDKPLHDWVVAQGEDQVIQGGSGDDMLAGGMMSDRFVFDPTQEGHDTVRDLESWDRIDLTAFGFGSDAAARAYLKQDGQDVIFDHQSVKISFENKMVSDFTDDLLLV